MTTHPSVNEVIQPELLARPIAGFGLTGRTLREELAGAPRLLVFLRHFG